jgi:hypothetical protein
LSWGMQHKIAPIMNEVHDIGHIEAGRRWQHVI